MSGSIEAYYDEIDRIERRGYIKGRKESLEEINKILENEFLTITESFVAISDLVYKELKK
jgi:hypothetical protein